MDNIKGWICDKVSKKEKSIQVVIQDKAACLRSFSNIKWNFTKFVINKEGKPVARFGPNEDPIPAVEDKVKELMAQP